MKDCSMTTTTECISEFILSRFGCSKISMSDRVSHFLNETVTTLIEQFHMCHQKSTPYHPEVNGIVEAFNKISENSLTKVCNVNRNDWDV